MEKNNNIVIETDQNKYKIFLNKQKPNEFQ